MKASNLTISIPVNGNVCDKNCPYCISMMTGLMKNNPELMQRNMSKVLTYSRACEITSVLITSKREPMLNAQQTAETIDYFKMYPVELQTNGIWLNQNQSSLIHFYQAGLNTIAFSIDSIKQIHSYTKLFAEVVKNNMMVRVCLNVTDIIPTSMGFSDIFQEVRNVGSVRQLLFRNVMIPSNVTSGKEYNWIKQHCSIERYTTIAEEFYALMKDEKKQPLRKLPHGLQVWGHKGISVSFSDYCVQEGNNNDDVRSLIYMEDGHLYDSWADTASIIF